MANVKKNFGYNLVLTFCNYLFPLITYPYISRVLGVENIGVCGFIDSIINYFVLFSMLGVGSLGVREVARTKGNTIKLKQVFSSLIAVNLFLTIIATAVLIYLTYNIDSFYEYKKFLYIGVIKLLFNIMYIDWFFQGIQNFKFITYVSIILRVFYILSLFIFVQNQDDTLLYYLLTTLLFVSNAIINWFYSKKYISFSWKFVKPSSYIVPILSFGYYRILTAMYTVFNPLYLGLKAGPVEVGYFTTATKINTLIMAVFTAFTTVMIPRVAELMKDNDRKSLQIIATKTISIVVSFAIPLILFCYLNAYQIIYIIAGDGYQGAVLPFRIIILLIFIIGIEQIVVQQFLMATNNNKSIALVSSIGALVGLSLNLFLTPRFAALGSSVSWGASELAVMLLGLFLLHKIVGIIIDYVSLIKQSILSFILYLCPLLLYRMFFPADSILSMLITLVIIVAVFIVIHFYVYDSSYVRIIFMQYIAKIRTKISI